MRATSIVTSHHRISGATQEQTEAILAAGRVTSPAYAKAVKRSARPWKRPAEFIEFARRDGDDVIASRGFTGAIRTAVPAIRFVDQRTRAPHALELRRELRPEQRACVDALARQQQGGAVGPTGVGKTAIIAGCVHAFGQRSLIVVPSLPILEQLARTVSDFLGERAAVIGEGRDELGDVTIATYASLRNPERRERVFAHVGALFVDEAHGITGDETRAIVDECPAAVRIALTATWPTDERAGIMGALFGPVLYRIAVPKMVQLGRLTRPEYRQVPTTFAGEGNDFAKLVEGTVVDPDRNALVDATVVANCGPNALGLALFGRVGHAEVSTARLRATGLRVECLTGGVRAAERERILTAARSGQLDVLCATSLADEGLDVPAIARLFLIAPQKAGGRFVQRIGRAMRPHPGKPTPICFDFVDERVGLLAHQARGRRAAFAAIWREEGAAA